MAITLAILAAAVPTAIYTLLLWWLDRYEKEPLALLFAAFLWGSLPAAALALTAGWLLELPLASTPLGPGVGLSGLAPIIEEPIKALALLALFQLARGELDGPLDGIVYGALVGFGFSMTENLLFFLIYPEDLTGLFWLRGVLFGLNHALFTSVVGLAFGTLRYARTRWAALLAVPVALLVAIALHALHNFAVDRRLPGLALSWLVQSAGVLAVLAVAVLSWRQEARWIAQELGDEIRLGTLGPADYAAVISAPRRARAELRALLAGGPAHYNRVRLLHHLLTELAFCKYQLALGDRHVSCAGRDELRRQIVALRAELAGTPSEDDEPLVA